MNAIVTNHIDAIKDLCEKHKVINLLLFGSATNQKFNDYSDIDFLIDFEKMDFGDYADNYFEFVEKLEKTLKRPVDLITTNSLQNPYFIKEIEKTKIQVYGYSNPKIFI